MHDIYTVEDVGLCVHAGDVIRVEPQSENTQPKALSLVIRLKKDECCQAKCQEKKKKTARSENVNEMELIQNNGGILNQPSSESF